MELNVININKRKTKRIVNKEEWTKEKRKRLRIAGKEYINAKGEVVVEKQPGPDCKCRRRCYEKVPKATRMKLFKGYYALKSHDEQNAYLFGLIRKVPIARKRAEGSTRRTCTFNYYIRVGGQETQVCVKALANIHGVGKSKIHILCEKLGQNVLFPRDERGRHSKIPKKVTDDTVEMAKQHIYSILHSDRARDFLKDEKANNGPDVNITQMHKDFLDNYDPEYAQELINYDKGVGGETSQQFNETYLTLSNEYRQEYVSTDGEVKVAQNIEVMVDADGNAHQVITPMQNNAIPNVVFTLQQQQQQPEPHRNKKKRKMTRDGRPEPIIRQWYYSKIFHELYTTKEAIALRKKILGWKSTDEFMIAKPTKKHRTPKKLVQNQPIVQQHIVLEMQPPSQQLDLNQQTHQIVEHPQIHVIQARLSKGTNTIPIPISAQAISPKRIVHEVQLQNIPIKKKPIQVFQAQGQDMYSIYPMILQDLTQMDANQALQPTQLRTLAPTHFQAVGQPTGNAMAITANGLQPLSLNINLTPTGTHYTATQQGIMSYTVP